MVIVHPHTVLEAEPCMVTGEPRFWGDVGENGKDELIWEFENYEGGMR